VLVLPVRSGWAADEVLRGGGPIPARNYNPVQILFLSLPIEQATTVPEGGLEVRLEAAESNAIMLESNSDANAQVKFETLRTSLAVKYGLPKRLEVGLEIPFLNRNSGFLDPFIVWIEKTFGYANPDRDKFQEGKFGGYEIATHGATVISGENNQSGLGDIVLNAKYVVLSGGPKRPDVAVRLAVKLPTGDFDKQFGSGTPDVGIGIALQKTVWNRLALYLNQNVVFPIGDFSGADLPLRPISTTALAGEFLWTSWFSLAAQLDYYTSPFYGTGVQVLDKPVFEIAVGLNTYLTPTLLWQLYGIENFHKPAKEAGADFTLGTTITLRLGRERA
jgi:hypothetical protein